MWLMLLSCVGVCEVWASSGHSDRFAADVPKGTVQRHMHKPGRRRLGKAPVNTRKR